MIRGLLANIADPGAAAALRGLLDSAETRVREAAISSLGYSGGPEDVHTIAAALDDGEPSVRREARGSLAELGGQAAADILAASLPGVRGSERDEVVQALAWLRDERALDAAIEIAEDAIFSDGGHRVWREGAWPAVRLAPSEWLDGVEARVIELLSSIDTSVPWQENPNMRAALNARQELLSGIGNEDWNERRRREGMIDQRSLAPEATARREHFGRMEAATPVDPLLPRMVPKFVFSEISDHAPPGAGPVAKFAGQPDWREEPAWPVQADGQLLVFYGQVPLLGDGQATAYIFIESEGSHFEPLGPSNAVVVQPGSSCHLPTVRTDRGPELFRWVDAGPRLRRLAKHERYENFVTLSRDADPSEWTWPTETGTVHREGRGDWNKVGGTPRYLQGEEAPPGDGWRFAFQFSADLTGRELGDGAECYGFVNQDGLGAFLWQCH
jgi:hypothetical protein